MRSFIACAALFFASAVHAQELTAGAKFERTLEPGAEHTYTAKLESGSAILATVDQEGVDVVIDVYAPDGKRVAQLDTPNGAQGPEPINLTVLQTGTYKFVVHALDKSSGKYVMSVDRIVSPVENATRLAKEMYRSDVLVKLWEASLTDAKAVEKFIADRDGKPLIEPIPDNTSQMHVTFFCLGDDDTVGVLQVGGADFTAGIPMHRVGKTNLFFNFQNVPTDARFNCAYFVDEVHHAGAAQVHEYVFHPSSLLEMPNAPPQSTIVAKDGVPKGELTQATIHSATLKEDRTVGVYVPAGYDGKKACNLLIVFDGITYGGGRKEQAEVPTPTILDNLIAEKRIGPTVAVFVWNMGKRNRDLYGSAAFADFIATEVVPWARAHYAIAPGSGSVVAAGSSAGGFSATYCAFRHSDAIGNVLSQSGAYWITKDWQNVRPTYPRDTGIMIGSKW